MEIFWILIHLDILEIFGISKKSPHSPSTSYWFFENPVYKPHRYFEAENFTTTPVYKPRLINGILR